MTLAAKDVLEKVLSKQALTCHYVEDAPEAVLVSYDVIESQTREKEEYVRLLNASTTYTHRQYPMEVLNVEVQASKEKERSAPKVELKPLPPNPRYVFLDPDHTFPVIVSFKLDGP